MHIRQPYFPSDESNLLIRMDMATEEGSGMGSAIPGPKESLDSLGEGEVDVEAGIVMLIARLFLIFGGAAPYVPQYIQIANTRDAAGFSTFVCLVVILSNVLRIAYWFGHWFDTALLIQSIVMTVVMLLLLELCLRTEMGRRADEGLPFEESNFLDFKAGRFWKWTNILSYIEATFAILALASLYTTTFSHYEFLIEPVGFIALLVESTLAMPQFMANYRNHSTRGMNIYMVILWTIGDLVKGFFFFHTNQPLPFRLCATIQLFVDAALFFQIGTYPS